jgi:hypothetical protein
VKTEVWSNQTTLVFESDGFAGTAEVKGLIPNKADEFGGKNGLLRTAHLLVGSIPGFGAVPVSKIAQI